jgi:hypothetical protein
VGVRYYAPQDLLKAAALPSDLNVFDDKSAIAGRFTAIAGILDARVERRLPGTLRIVLREEAPVAFASGPQGFVALDAEAQPLPYDPSRNAIDLPVVERPDPILTSLLATLRAVDPEFFDVVEYVHRNESGGVSVAFEDHQVLFDSLPAPAAIEAAAAVKRHLRATGTNFSELDVRYDGWVVVRGGAST